MSYFVNSKDPDEMLHHYIGSTPFVKLKIFLTKEYIFF